MDILVTQNAGSVSCDFDAAKAALNATLDEYRGIVFTEDSKKDAKNVVAELRKNKKAFQDRIKEVKAEYMKPYDDFNKKALELVAMFDEPIDFINGQVQEFEAKRIGEKREEIKHIYEDIVAGEEYADYVPLEKIYNPKWENATYKEKAIMEDMQESYKTARAGVELIKGMHSDVEAKALELFKVSLDAMASVAYINRHAQEKAEILERERERVKNEEIERARKEERERVEAERRAEEEKQAALTEAREQFLDDLIPVYDGAESESVTYAVKVTQSEKESLELYMTSIGVDWQIVPKLPI